MLRFGAGVQVCCYEDSKLLKLFTDIVRMLYDNDILAEDTIRWWAKKVGFLCPRLMMFDSLCLQSVWVQFPLKKLCSPAPLQQKLMCAPINVCRALTPRGAMSSCETWSPS